MTLKSLRNSDWNFSWKNHFSSTIKCSGVFLFLLLSLFLTLIRKSQLLFRLLNDVKNSWRIPEEFCGHQNLSRNNIGEKQDDHRGINQEFRSEFQLKKQLTLPIHFTNTTYDQMQWSTSIIISFLHITCKKSTALSIS